MHTNLHRAYIKRHYAKKKKRDRRKCYNRREITYNKPIHGRRYGNVKSISTDILALTLHCGCFYTFATQLLCNYWEYFDNVNAGTDSFTHTDVTEPPALYFVINPSSVRIGHLFK